MGGRSPVARRYQSLELVHDLYRAATLRVAAIQVLLKMLELDLTKLHYCSILV